MRGKFSLGVEMPLLDVRPNGFVGNGINSQGEKQSPADISIASDVKLLGGQHERRGTFQGFCIALVAVGVLEKDAVPAANSHLAVALRIEGKPNARRGVKEMSLQAARRRRSANTRWVSRQRSHRPS